MQTWCKCDDVMDGDASREEWEAHVGRCSVHEPDGDDASE